MNTMVGLKLQVLLKSAGSKAMRLGLDRSVKQKNSQVVVNESTLRVLQMYLTKDERDSLGIHCNQTFQISIRVNHKFIQLVMALIQIVRVSHTNLAQQNLKANRSSPDSDDSDYRLEFKLRLE